MVKLKDRFGPVPGQMIDLFEGLRIRWTGKRLGMERIIFKNNRLRCYFLGNAKSSFYETPFFQELLKLISTAEYKKDWHLKQTTDSLILGRDGVKNVRMVKKLLEELLARVESRLVFVNP